MDVEMDFTKCPRKCCPKKVLKAPLYKCQFGTFLAAPWGVSPIDTNKKTLTCHYFRFQDREWGGQKGPPRYKFFACNFYNRRNYPQNFLAFSFNPFSILLQHFKFVPSTSHKLLNLNKDHPPPLPPPKKKKAVFVVKSL